MGVCSSKPHSASSQTRGSHAATPLAGPATHSPQLKQGNGEGDANASFGQSGASGESDRLFHLTTKTTTASSIIATKNGERKAPLDHSSSSVSSRRSSDDDEPEHQTEQQSTAALQQQASTLEDSKRRRLSVSTVKVEDGEDALTKVREETRLQQEASALAAARTAGVPCLLLGKAVSIGDAKQVDLSRVEEAEPAANETQASRRRSRIKHFPDPSLELLDEKSGTIRSVTIEMIMDLASDSESTYMVFGSASDASQRGFDNKKMNIVGSLAGKWEPASDGVGFACKKGLKPESPNQDDFFIIRVDDWTLYGVFDGHGPYGHDVSSFVHRTLPFLVMGDAQFESDPCLVMRKAFRKVHHLVEALSHSSSSTMDCTLSGSTGTLVLHRDDKLFIAHVGDSRGILASKAANHQRTEATDLTIDHKPTREEEKKRIEASGGEVRQLEGDIPHRVFVKRRMYPGLAMSRAIGDSIGSAVGVIPDPDVKVVDLSSSGSHQFVVVATDGVWEFISSQEAVDYVCQKGKVEVQKAAEFLAYESWRRWIEEEENVVDDVTCIVFWVDQARRLSTQLKDDLPQLHAS